MAGSPPIRDPIVYQKSGKLTPVWERYFILTLNEKIDKLLEEIRTRFENGSVPFVEDERLVEDKDNFSWDNVNKILSVFDLIINNLSASRLIYTDAGKVLMSIDDLSAWIKQTLKQVLITDNGDGTITASTPQDIDIDSDVEFNTLKLGDMTQTLIPFFGVGGLISEIATFFFSSGLHLKADSLKMLFGAGDDLSVFYDGTSGNIKSDEIAVSDLKITCGANKTIELQNVVYNDLYFEIAPKTVGAGKPTLASFYGNINQWQMAINDISELRPTELVHKWKEGSEIEIHVHWASNGVDGTDRGVKWEIDYTWSNSLDTTIAPTAFAAATTVSSETLIPASTPDKTYFYTSVVSFTPATGKIGAGLLMSLKRIASVTNPTPSKSPWVMMVGVHYQANTIGSRQIGTK